MLYTYTTHFVVVYIEGKPYVLDLAEIGWELHRMITTFLWPHSILAQLQGWHVFPIRIES